MTKRSLLMCACLLMSAPAWAGSIVTWESFGTLTTADIYGYEYTGLIPDPGSPYHLTISFDRDAMRPTPLSPAGSDCNTVAPVTGTMSLGAVDFGIRGGYGFTHAQLPGTNCTPGAPETQFLLGLTAPADNPWTVLQDAFMEMWYVDLVDADGFPAVPTDTFGGFQIRSQAGSFHIHGPIDLEAVGASDGGPIDPAPVPEPGTLSLLALGLAAAIRRKRLSR
jgi:hypothetical protein